VAIEKCTVFERFGNLRAVFFKVPTSSQEYSQLEDTSSASRTSRNHITSRKELDLLLSFGLIEDDCRPAIKKRSPLHCMANQIVSSSLCVLCVLCASVVKTSLATGYGQLPADCRHK